MQVRGRLRQQKESQDVAEICYEDSCAEETLPSVGGGIIASSLTEGLITAMKAHFTFIIVEKTASWNLCSGLKKFDLVTDFLISRSA